MGGWLSQGMTKWVPGPLSCDAPIQPPYRAQDPAPRRRTQMRSRPVLELAMVSRLQLGHLWWTKPHGVQLPAIDACGRRPVVACCTMKKSVRQTVGCIPVCCRPERLAGTESGRPRRSAHRAINPSRFGGHPGALRAADTKERLRSTLSPQACGGLAANGGSAPKIRHGISGGRLAGPESPLVRCASITCRFRAQDLDTPGRRAMRVTCPWQVLCASSRPSRSNGGGVRNPSPTPAEGVPQWSWVALKNRLAARGVSFRTAALSACGSASLEQQVSSRIRPPEPGQPWGALLHPGGSDVLVLAPVPI